MGTPLPFKEDRQEGEVADGDVDAEEPKIRYRVSHYEPFTGITRKPLLAQITGPFTSMKRTLQLEGGP